MTQEIFISYCESDSDVSVPIARELEKAGYMTWYYERDTLPGVPYLIQVGNAIEQCRAVVVMVSPCSLESQFVENEVVHAHESKKCFIPILRDLKHAEFQKRALLLRQAFGAAVSFRLPAGPSWLSETTRRIIAGLKTLGIEPKTQVLSPSPDSGETVLQIKVIEGREKGKAGFIKDREICVVGRSKKAHFSVSGDQHISRAHFSLDVHGPQCLIRDLNSTDGTFLNGQKITQEFLSDGDIIQAGDTQILVKFIEPASSSEKNFPETKNLRI